MIYKHQNLIVGKQVSVFMVYNTVYQCIGSKLLKVFGVQQEQRSFLI